MSDVATRTLRAQTCPVVGPIRLALSALAALAGSFSAADASFEVCNKGPEPVFTAIAYPSGSEWFAKGWWRIEPSRCETLIGGRLTSRHYALRAEAEGADLVWDGDYWFCTTDSAFTLAQNDRPCSSSTRSWGYQKEGFFIVDTGDSTSFTQNLTCSDCRYWKGGRLKISLPAVQTSTWIDGRRVTVPVSGELDAQTSGGDLQVSVRADADLGELQRLLPGMIRRQVEGGSDCNDRVDLHRVDVRARGSHAEISIGGKYERWECWSWHQPEIHGLSIKYKKRTAKNKVFTQDGSGVLEIHPTVSNNVVSVSTELRSLRAGGLLGELMRDGFLGPRIRSEIRNAIPRTITVSDLRTLIPAELRPYQPRLHRVEFRDLGGGRLGLRAHASITVTGAQVSEVLRSLQR